MSPSSDNGSESESADRSVLVIGEQPLLSDEDVEILYQIVSRAEKDPAVQRLPFRAIFAAYDAVLADRGISSEHDQIYLRCLFKLGETRQDETVEEQTLFERFERMLAGMGIELAYDEDERERRGQQGRDQREEGGSWSDEARAGKSDVETPTHARVGADLEQRTTDFGTPTDRSRRGKRRRASFNSMYDATATADLPIAKRPSSRSSMSRLQVGKSPFSKTTRESPKKTNSRMPLDQRHLQTGFGNRSGVRHTGPEETDHQHLRREEQEYRKQVLKDWRDSTPQMALSTKATKPAVSKHSQALYDDSSLDAATSTTLGDDSPIRRVAVLSPRQSRSTETRQPRDRDREPSSSPKLQPPFYPSPQRHIHSSQIRQAQERRAVHHDRWNLLWDAFNRWLSLSRANQQERFYAEVERRVLERRSLNLAQYAFDQWILATAREKNRTALARRHMLRKKYFKLWRELTAANELKVQRLSLQTPFRRWRKAYVRIWANDIAAIQICQENLLKRMFWQWFFSYCERNAPKLLETNLKKRFTFSWLDALFTIRKRTRIAENQHEQNLKQSALQLWFKRRGHDQSMERLTVDFRRGNLLQRCVTVWRKQSQLAPLAARISNMVDWRIARSTSATWILRTRMAKRAAEVDRLRILRNTWTDWNDRLRWQTLEARVDDRLILQSLYKWVLTSRFNLMRRVHERRVQVQTLHKLISGFRKVITPLEHRETQVRDNGDRHLAATALNLLKAKMQSQRQKDQLALNFHFLRIEHQSLEAWRGRHRHIHQMEGWARDAEFFFLTRKMMKAWKQAAGEAKRLKRREAYAQIRRRVKINLATSAIEMWRSRLDQLRRVENQAQRIHDDKDVRFGVDMLQKWRERTSSLCQHLDTADSHYSNLLLGQTLRLWTGRVQALRDLESRGDQFSQIHVLDASAPLLRKFRFRIFDIQKRQENADSMNDRNYREHVRNMVRHWKDQVLSRNLLNAPDFTRSVNPNLQSTDRLEGGGMMVQSGELTHYGEPFDANDWLPGLEAQSSSTPMPLPGYLNTPSKRAIRARALAQMSMTPATPMRTSFASRLRSQAEPGTISRAGRRGSVSGQSQLVIGDKVVEEGTMAGKGNGE